MNPTSTDGATPELARVMDRIQRWALAACVIALLVCGIGLFVWTTQFFRSWLTAWLMFLGIALGSMSIEMLHFLTGGQWGFVIRQPMEAASRTLPLLAVLFIPVLLGIHVLYPWANPAVVAQDAVLQHKHAYLNIPFFVVRACIYFGIWITGSVLLTRWSARQQNPRKYVGIRALSAIGLILYVFTITFASLDWAQSLEPHWYSTMWGFLFVAGQGLTAMSFLIATLIVLAQYPPLSDVVTRRHLHDLGKLLLMFVMLWAYFSFSQLLIIWSGNLSEEVPWYVHRLNTDWQWTGLILALLEFLLPFLLLLSRPLKRHARTLLFVAGLLFLMRLLDVFWLVMPSMYSDGFHVHILDIAAVIGIGGLWLAVFVWLLRRRPLLPVGDPKFAEALKDAG